MNSNQLIESKLVSPLSFVRAKRVNVKSLRKQPSESSRHFTREGLDVSPEGKITHPQRKFYQIFENPDMYLREECLDAIKPYRFGKMIAEGGFGTVFDLCLKDGCHYIVKIMPLFGHLSEANLSAFQKEVAVTKLMSDHKITPRFVDSFVCLGRFVNIHGDESHEAGILVTEK